MHVAVDGRVVFIDGDTATRIDVRTRTEDDTLVGILCIDLHPLPSSGVVTTGHTPAGTQFEEVNPRCSFLEPFLFADYPTC